MARTLDRRCGKCGASLTLEDVGKDRLGRPVCRGCAAAAEDEAAGGADERGIELDAVAVADEVVPCPACKRPMAVSGRVCAGCGFDREALGVAKVSYGAAERAAAGAPAAGPACRKCGYDLTGLEGEKCPECGTDRAALSGDAARREKRRERGLERSRKCAGCGYDLKGLPTRTCPECGVVNTRRGAQEALSKREMRRQRLKAYLMCAGGVLAMLIVQASVRGMTAAGLGLAMVFAACTVGFAVYRACEAMFIGFDEPVGQTFAKFCAVQGMYFGLSALTGLITYAWCFGWPLRAIIYVFLILWIMEVDVEDAWSVSLAGVVVNIALYLGFIALLP